MADKVTWFELPAFDVSRAGEFYKQVFGWETSDMGGGSLSVKSSESDEELTPLERGSINGDISPISEGFDKPLIVITVEDINKKVEIVKQAGGIVVLEPKLIEEMSMYWSIVQDTEGNRVGVIQTA